MSIETNSAEHNQKNILRVVLVNHKGLRVLDTYIKPQFSECHTKQGIKSSLFLLAKTKGEPIKEVRERVRALIHGKSLVGYHLP